MSIDMLKETLERQRHAHSHRFCQASDRSRLAVLGVILLCFSVIALADAFAPGQVFGKGSGSPAMFGGAAITLFIVKIGRTEPYIDWIVNGALYIALGLSLIGSVKHDETWSQMPFCVLLMVSGVMRVWLGSTARPQSGGAWLCLSGGIAFISGFVAITGWALETPLPPLLIMAGDLLLFAISIVRYSFGLR